MAEKRDPAIDAVNALMRAEERHSELWDNWDERCVSDEEEPQAVQDALHAWEDLQLTLAQTPAKTVWGALAKADFLAKWADEGEIRHHGALCRSIRDDYARLRKGASRG